MKKAKKFLALILMCMLPLMLSCGWGGGGGGEADTSAPSVPTGLTVVASSVPLNQINLSWTASTDNIGVTGYKIYRGGSYLKSVTTTSTSDTGLNLLTQYCYTVSAYDAAGNESTKSSQVCATTSGFSIADFQGTWYSHDLQSGDAGPGRSRSAWFYGWSTIDANGNCIAHYEVESDGSINTTCEGDINDLNLDPATGVLTAIGFSGHGIVSKWKDLIVFVADDGTGDYRFSVSIKSGGTFTTADLQGNWWNHGLVSGDAPAQRIGWFWTNWSSNASGNFTALSHRDSTGLTTLPAGMTFSVRSNGVVTSAALPSFYGIKNQKW